MGSGKPSQNPVKRSSRILVFKKTTYISLREERKHTVSIMASDKVQLTQDQIAVRWMGPDGSVSLTKGLHSKYSSGGRLSLHGALQGKQTKVRSSQFPNRYYRVQKLVNDVLNHHSRS
jgi:hypothetical protein